MLLYLSALYKQDFISISHNFMIILLRLKNYKQGNKHFSGSTDFRTTIFPHFCICYGKFLFYAFLLYFIVYATFLNYGLIFSSLTRKVNFSYNSFF